MSRLWMLFSCRRHWPASVAFLEPGLCRGCSFLGHLLRSPGCRGGWRGTCLLVSSPGAPSALATGTGSISRPVTFVLCFDGTDSACLSSTTLKRKD